MRFLLSSTENQVLLIPDGTTQNVPVGIVRNNDSNDITLTTAHLPAGVTANYTQPGSGSSGVISFTTSTNAQPANSQVTVTASDGQGQQSFTLPVQVAVLETVSTSPSNPIATFLSTNLQPDNGDTFLQTVAGATGELSALHPQHLRTFPLDSVIPLQDTNKNWDFSQLNNVLAPAQREGVQNAGDGLPMLLLYPPSFMLPGGLFPTTDPSKPGSPLKPDFISNFAAYCADMVAYYNTTDGFTAGPDGNTTYKKDGSIQPILWWAIMNEPNEVSTDAAASYTDSSGNVHTYNVPMDGTQYADLYFAAVQAMQQINPNIAINFVGPEVADVPISSSSGPFYAPTLVQDFATELNNRNLPYLEQGQPAPAPVSVVSVHHYGSCSPFGESGESDADVLARITAESVPDLQKVVSTADSAFLQSSITPPGQNPVPVAIPAPVWIDENQVNADYGTPGGDDHCGQSTPYQTDPRNSDAFFAAYRPYFYSQMAQNGAQGIFHFRYEGATYGEVASLDAVAPLMPGDELLPYWVDYYLARAFSYCPEATAFCTNTNSVSTLVTASTDTGNDIETLAAYVPGGLTIMVVNHAVANSSTDYDGPGVPISVVVDVSAFTGADYTQASAVVIDKTINLVTGPSAITLDPKQTRFTVSFAGYGVAFISLSL